jgi:hypothetical protein
MNKGITIAQEEDMSEIYRRLLNSCLVILMVIGLFISMLFIGGAGMLIIGM